MKLKFQKQKNQSRKKFAADKIYWSDGEASFHVIFFKWAFALFWPSKKAKSIDWDED